MPLIEPPIVIENEPEELLIEPPIDIENKPEELPVRKARRPRLPRAARPDPNDDDDDDDDEEDDDKDAGDLSSDPEEDQFPADYVIEYFTMVDGWERLGPDVKLLSLGEQLKAPTKDFLKR